MRLRALYAVPGATPLYRAPPLVRANVTREPSPRSLALRLLKTARSALGVHSNFKRAWPSAMYVQLAASLTNWSHKHASSATTIHTVTLQGHPNAPHVQSERWRSPREASNVSSQCLAAPGSTVTRVLRHVTLVVRVLEVRTIQCRPAPCAMPVLVANLVPYLPLQDQLCAETVGPRRSLVQTAQIALSAATTPYPMLATRRAAFHARQARAPSVAAASTLPCAIAASTARRATALAA